MGTGPRLGGPSPVGVDHAPGGLDPYAPERDAWTVLSSVRGLGPLGFAALLSRYGTGRHILRAAGEADAARHLASTRPLDPSSDRRSAIPL
ncbi:MAG: hypothetical protein ACRDIL_02645, partial [Candidatus Limnocylindrales bacterium]